MQYIVSLRGAQWGMDTSTAPNAVATVAITDSYKSYRAVQSETLQHCTMLDQIIWTISFPTRDALNDIHYHPRLAQ
jgi:hypothetical protein